jgi:putative oxidoreductase
MEGPIPSNWAPVLRSVLRIVAALSYLTHGLQKMLAFPAPPPSGHAVPLLSLLGVASVIEVIGGALLVLGLFTRPVAFLVCGEMAVAYFRAHAPRAFWPILNGGELAMLFCFIWLYIAAAGPGPISLDALRGGGRGGSRTRR